LQLLEQANDDIEADRAIQNTVGREWDDEFGHCFPNLMEGIVNGEVHDHVYDTPSDTQPMVCDPEDDTQPMVCDPEDDQE
jgi:hypothetical protein